MKTKRKLIANSQVLWIVIGRQTPEAKTLTDGVFTTYEAAERDCEFQNKLWPEGCFSVQAANFRE